MPETAEEKFYRMIAEEELGEKGEQLKELVKMRESINELIENTILSLTLR